MKTPWWFMRKTLISFLLLPLAVVYFAVTKFVFTLRKMRAYKSKRIIICVGNILAGGVGKTPIVRQIANFLDAPVVMRGYKKNIKTGHSGDEAIMLAQDGLQVHTGNRKANILLLNNQSDEKSPIIMDDGFQNPKIKKDISILVFDEGIGLGNGFLLPAGPLREGISAIKRADAIIVIKSNKQKKNFKLPNNIPIFFAENKTIVPYSNKVKLFAFAGIGYPKKFFTGLKNLAGTRAFPDHYQYNENDIRKLMNAAEKYDAKLVTTEKDWVRLPQDVQKKIKYVQLVTTIDNDFFIWLQEKIKCQH